MSRDLNLKLETMKLLEKNKGEVLHTGLGNDFFFLLDTKKKGTKAKINEKTASN